MASIEQGILPSGKSRIPDQRGLQCLRSFLEFGLPRFDQLVLRGFRIRIRIRHTPTSFARAQANEMNLGRIAMGME